VEGVCAEGKERGFQVDFAASLEECEREGRRGRGVGESDIVLGYLGVRSSKEVSVDSVADLSREKREEGGVDLFVDGGPGS
jgi:hypothetical protein